MLIEMKTTYASDHGTCEPGGRINLPDDEARDLIASGFAVLVTPAAVPVAPESAARIEAASDAQHVETAAAHTRAPRGRQDTK